MRILITTGIFPPDIGGPATELDYLIREIQKKKDFKFTVLTFGENNINYPYEVIKISKRNPKFFRNIYYFLKTFYLSFKKDIIYSWDLYTAGFSSFVIKKIMPQKKLIIRFVGDSAWEYYFNEFQKNSINSDNIIEFQDKKYGFKIEFKKWLRKKMLTSADTVVVPSAFMKEAALKIGVLENRIKLIYNSVDFLFDESEIRELEGLNKNSCEQELNFKENVFYLVSVSRLVAWKGQETLIEIMPDLIKKYGKINLFIIGEGPEAHNLKLKIKNLDLEGSVFLLGKLDHKQVFKYLKCADIFILNTFYEGLSHTILEAMKVGVPIIASNVCSNSELISDGKNGFLFEYNDKKGIIESVEKIIQKSELRELFLKESEKKLEGFRFNKLAEETIELLSCLKLRNPASA